jgi:hypothetical protein
MVRTNALAYSTGELSGCKSKKLLKNYFFITYLTTYFWKFCIHKAHSHILKKCKSYFLNAYLRKFCEYTISDLCYKTLRIRNVRKMGQLCSKLVYLSWRTTLCVMIPSITTFSIMTLSIKDLYETLRIKDSYVTLSINVTEHNNALHYDEYRSVVMLNIIMINVVMLSVVAPLSIVSEQAQ